MIFWRLALKSLLNRRLSTFLTALSIALSVALLLSVERARRAAEEGFTSAVSQVDLLVGARSGPLQLILYSVFNMGGATHNISWSTYEKWSKNPAVDWTIPYSLGDGHKGFRTVATTNDFFEHYRFRGTRAPELEEGKTLGGIWDVVIGSDVEKNLKYKLGDKIVLAHGSTTGDSFENHADKPFTVAGILKPTGTPIDRSLYISLAGMEAIHVDWQDGAAPSMEKRTKPEDIKPEDLKVKTITSFFLRSKSRIETLRLQREINMDTDEPLLAIIPGATLQDLWRSLGYVEGVLKMVSVMVVLVGFAAMIIALTTTLNERRREMAILRSLGAGSARILGLLVFESALLTAAGVVLGLVINLAGFALLEPWLEHTFGLFLTGAAITPGEVLILVAIFVAGVAVGLIPAISAQRQALKDGLSVRV